MTASKYTTDPGSAERTITERFDGDEHLIIVERWLDRQWYPPRWRSKNRRRRLKPSEVAYYRLMAENGEAMTP